MELAACHVHKRMVKIGDMIKVDNKSAVRLKKNSFSAAVSVVCNLYGCGSKGIMDLSENTAVEDTAPTAGTDTAGERLYG